MPIAEMFQNSRPLSLPDNVKAKILAAYQDCINETKRMQKGLQTDYIQALGKYNDKFQSVLINNKGVWHSKKVFWWTAGVAYVLLSLGFCIIVWILAH